MKKFILTSISMYALPLVAMAQTYGSLDEVFQSAVIWLNRLIPFIIGLGVIFFIGKIFNAIRSADKDESRSEAKNTIIYGIVFIFVMVSVWGLVNILVGSFNLQDQVPESRIPRVPSTR